jgi:hypothetical protein
MNRLNKLGEGIYLLAWALCVLTFVAFLVFGR